MHPSRTIRKVTLPRETKSALTGPGCYSLVFEDPREWSTELDEPTAEHEYSELELSASRR
jgi:hypothetical protein